LITSAIQLWLIEPVKELLIATNPDPDSTLAYLMWVPFGEGIVLRTAGTWPRTKALYCYPVSAEEWPTFPDIVERVPLRSCTRRGAAIDIVAARFRENRSQLVFTTARGRDAVFWQSPRTRKQARPQVSLPSARAAGITELEIVVDARERSAYRFAGQQVRTTSRGLPCGDYGIIVDGALAAAVERKSLPDLIGSPTSGRLRYALGELAALPRAAVVVEERYSQIYKQDRVRPALVADGLAECQVRWPNVPIVFCETRGLAEEWTYRYLAAAHAWASTEPAAIERIGEQPALRPLPEVETGPSPAEIRDWARRHGHDIPDRGRIPASVRQAWERSMNPPDP
jgi:ERCC4 domain/Lsr2